MFLVLQLILNLIHHLHMMSKHQHLNVILQYLINVLLNSLNLSYSTQSIRLHDLLSLISGLLLDRVGSVDILREEGLHFVDAVFIEYLLDVPDHCGVCL